MKVRYVAFSAMICSASLGQMKDVPDSTDQIGWDMEAVLGEETEDSDDSQPGTILDELEEHPLDLNTATGDQLSQIPGLDALLISRILERRNQGIFSSVKELREIDGISGSLFRLLRRCLVVRTAGSREQTVTTIRTRAVSSTELSRGFLEKSFLGDRVKSFTRINTRAPVHIGKETILVEANAASEKDAGEQIGDFVSGFINVSASSFKVIIGDYRMESAAGLVFPRKYSTTRGADVLGPARFGTQSVGYTSTEENFFLRGVLAQIRIAGSGLTVFVSKKSLNGTVDSAGSLVSLDRSGLFRTTSERNHKSVAFQTIVGGYADLSPTDEVKIGLKFFESHMDHSVFLSGLSRPRSAGSFGADVRFIGNGWILFGEVARNRSNVLAAQTGFQFEPDRSFDLLVVVHAVPRSFENVYHVSFTDESERGLYAGVVMRPRHDINIRCSVNRGFDRWNNTVSPFPISWNRCFGGIEITIGPKSACRLEYRANDGSVQSSTNARTTDSRKQQSIRFTMNMRPSPFLQSRSRIEVGRVSYGDEKPDQGMLVSQDLTVKFGRLTLTGRLAVFDTGSFDSRVYEYEDDLAGTFTTPALYGRGIRSYILLSWGLSDGIQLGAKYASTVRDGARIMGSGLDELQGDLAGVASIQLDIRL